MSSFPRHGLTQSSFNQGKVVLPLPFTKIIMVYLGFDNDDVYSIKDSTEWYVLKKFANNNIYNR